MRVRGAHWLDYNYLHDNFSRHAKVSITSALGKVSPLGGSPIGRDGAPARR